MTVGDLAKSIEGPFDILSAPERRRLAVYRAGQSVVAQVLGLIEFDEAEGLSNQSPIIQRIQIPAFPTEQFSNGVIAFLMAGRAAEEIMMDAVSVFGASPDTADLAIATWLARELEVRSGLGEIGLVDLYELQIGVGLPLSVIGGVRRRIEAGIQRASVLILENEPEILRLVDGIFGPRTSPAVCTRPVLH